MGRVSLSSFYSTDFLKRSPEWEGQRRKTRERREYRDAAAQGPHLRPSPSYDG
jgi:hypothetical protein